MDNTSVTETPEAEIIADILVRVRNSLNTMIDRETERKDRRELLKKLGISYYHFRSIIDGTYNGRLSELISIAVKLGYKPEINFTHPIFSET